MMSFRFFPPRTSGLVLAVVLVTAAAWACSVPVFRYALEHWHADPFHLTIFHKGPLTEAEQEMVRALTPAAGSASANVSVATADLAGELTAELKRLAALLPADSPLPQAVLRFPRIAGIQKPVVNVPLAEAKDWHLSDSPARQEIVNRLAQGQSAVWVLLESGDKAQDDAAEKVLEERLDYLGGVLKLPELEEADIANGLVSVGQDDLRLEFSVLRISRTAPGEKTFVPMLLATEDGLDEVEEPMVFPVFGRGRALYALVGQGIRAETIESAATFLIGKCSCQVKEQNPGVDLLLAADWAAMAKASPLMERELPNLAHLAQASAPETVTTEPQTEQTAKGRSGLGAAAIAALLAAGLIAARLMRKRD
jgi:hypothetical protein